MTRLPLVAVPIVLLAASAANAEESGCSLNMLWGTMTLNAGQQAHETAPSDSRRPLPIPADDCTVAHFHAEARSAVS